MQEDPAAWAGSAATTGIRSEAKSATGQSLSRLLNLTDGLLGQGRDVLVAITTNEDVAMLHPAVVRPGRCLARISVGPLPYQQAVQWLGSSTGIGPDGATLAVPPHPVEARLVIGALWVTRGRTRRLVRR